jgi:hypothetical protein
MYGVCPAWLQNAPGFGGAGEHTPKTAKAALPERANTALGQAELRRQRGVLGRVSGKVEGHQQIPAAGVEIIQRTSETLGALDRQNSLLGRNLGGGQALFGHIVEWRPVLALEAPPADDAHGGPSRDRCQPSDQPLRVSYLIEVLPPLDANVLEHFAGVILAEAVLERDRIDATAVAIHQLSPGVVASGKAPIDERSI